MMSPPPRFSEGGVVLSPVGPTEGKWMLSPRLRIEHC
jgi:hypothetical protein